MIVNNIVVVQYLLVKVNKELTAKKIAGIIIGRRKVKKVTNIHDQFK